MVVASLAPEPSILSQIELFKKFRLNSRYNVSRSSSLTLTLEIAFTGFSSAILESILPLLTNRGLLSGVSPGSRNAREKIL